MSSMVLSGDTSGAITVTVPAVAGTNTLTLPAVTGNILASTSQLIGLGVTNGSAASAGQVGEYTDVSTTFISVSTGTNLTSLTLTAGEWDITGAVQLYGSSGANAVYGAINTTSGSVTGVYGQNYVLAATYNAGGTGIANISRYRVNISSTTTYYLNASIAGTANNCLGFMSARRMR